MKAQSHSPRSGISRLHWVAPWVVHGVFVLAAFWEARFTPEAMPVLRPLAIAPILSWMTIVFLTKERSQLHVIACLLPAIAVLGLIVSERSNLETAVALAPCAVLMIGLVAAARVFSFGWRGKVTALLLPGLLFFFSVRSLPPVRADLLYGRIWSPEEEIRWAIDLHADYLRNHDGAVGLRLTDRFLPFALPEGERRIIVLGSSQVISPGISNREKTFTRVLESSLRRRDPNGGWRVYNAGLYGTDIIQWVFWRDLLVRARPEILILYESGAMIEPFQDRVVFKRAERIDGDLEAAGRSDLPYRRAAFRWGSASRPVIAIRRLLRENRLGLHLVRLLRMRRVPPEIDAETIIPSREPPAPTRITVLEWFADSCRKARVRLILVPGVHWNLDFADPRYAELMQRAAERFGGEYLDARPSPTEAGEGLFLDGSHFSVAGSRRVGELLAERVLSPSGTLTSVDFSD